MEIKVEVKHGDSFVFACLSKTDEVIVECWIDNEERTIYMTKEQVNAVITALQINLEQLNAKA